MNIETASRAELIEYLLAHDLGIIEAEETEGMRDAVRAHMETRDTGEFEAIDHA